MYSVIIVLMWMDDVIFDLNYLIIHILLKYFYWRKVEPGSPSFILGNKQ